MDFHPLANLFPLLEGEAFEGFVADIADKGVAEPIWLYDGQVLDGRNRYRACEQLGIACPTRDYTGDDPVGFVVSMNLQRRHLDESQRGMVAARLATMRQGERTDLVEISTKLSQAKAAEMLNVSRETVVAARKVQTEGAPEVIAAVDTGEMTLSAALPLIDIPKDEQSAILEELHRETAGKRPTATHTKAAVSRVQVVATVKERLAAGDTPQGAVSHAMQQHEIVLPTPGLADAIAQATDRQVTLAATDGLLHDGRTKADEAAAMAQTRRMFQLFNALEALATLPDLASLIAEIPEYSAYRINDYLDTAYATFTIFRTLWKESPHGDAWTTCRSL